MNTIKGSLDIIVNGDEDSSRLAVGGMRNVVYSSGKSRDSSEDIYHCISTAPDVYRTLEQSWRQEYFVRAVAIIYFLRSNEELPDFLFPWLFHLLQDPNGKMRYAAVRMITHEIGALTVHIRHPESPYSTNVWLEPEEADRIIYSLYTGLRILLDSHWSPKYGKYKYISDMPSSPYKSAQMVISDLVEMCDRRYVQNMEKFLEI